VLSVIARRSNTTAPNKFYGTTAAVYRARLTPAARERAMDRDASSLCYGDFALKIIYNLDASITYDELTAVAQFEIDLFKRLPRHDNVVRIEHYFSDRIPTNPTPPNWDADMSIVAPHALFIVMEQCYLSLQDVISYRKSSPSTIVATVIPSTSTITSTKTATVIPTPTITAESLQSLFTPAEVLMVGHHISSALCLLNKELVVHRDVKPDNILIRFPAHISRRRAMTNIAQPGITVALTDFGMTHALSFSYVALFCFI
jgi:serine/threonine protein kinase